MVSKELHNSPYGTTSEPSEKAKVGDHSGQGVPGLGGSSPGRFSLLAVEGACEGTLALCGVGIFLLRALSFLVVLTALPALQASCSSSRNSCLIHQKQSPGTQDA